MKAKIILLLFVIVGAYSCRKDNPPAPAPTPAPTTADYRDTVLGNYIGTRHFLYTDQFGAIVITDTTYTDTILVTKNATVLDVIYFDGMHANLHTNYAIGDDDYWYPHGGIGGSFTLSNDSLELHYGGGWAGYSSTNWFTGIK